MFYEENYMTYVEDEGCCRAVKYKFRKNKHIFIICFLLILAVVSIAAGLYNGFTLKKYSDLAIIVGIFFPSVIIVFVCIYLAFICGRESFRSSVLSRIRHSSDIDNSHHSQDTLQRFQTKPATRGNLRVRYQPKGRTESANSSAEIRIEEPHFNEKDYAVDDCGSKISKKHFRSLSNSDISKHARRNYHERCRNPEACEISCRRTDDNQYSPKFQRHEPRHKEFKRSVSDTVCKNRYKRSGVDRTVWNAQSLSKLKRQVDQMNSVKDTEIQSDCESSYVAMENTRKNLYPQNYKSEEEYEIVTRCEDYEDGVRRYRNRTEQHVNVSPRENVLNESCYPKSEIRLYSSSVLNPPYEYKETVQFSSSQPGRKDGIASCSKRGDFKHRNFSRSNTLELKSNSKIFGNSSSDQATYSIKRKTIYFPFSSNRDSTRPSLEYAHEFCKYSKRNNNVKQSPFPRNRDFNDHQSEKQVRFHWQ